MLALVVRSPPLRTALLTPTCSRSVHSSAALLAGRRYQKTIRDKNKSNTAKSNVITKVMNMIRRLVGQGGPDPETNPLLSNALARAREMGMPKATLLAALNSSGADKTAFEAVTYEARAGGGAGALLIIETLTDNRMRTAPQVRSTLKNHGGSLGVAAKWAFDLKGLVQCRVPLQHVAAVMDVAIEAGADDVEDEADDSSHLVHVDVYCPLTEANNVRTAIKAFVSSAGCAEEADVAASSTFVVNTPTLVDEAQWDTLMQLVEDLEDLDDVQRVFHNAALATEQK